MTTPSEARPDLPFRMSDLPWLSWGLLLGSGLIVFGPLTLTWNDNPNYSFGWLIPLVSIFLFVERWPTRPPREVNERSIRVMPLIFFWGLVFFLFRLAAEADPDWRPGLWIMIGLYVAVLLGWLWVYGGFAWMRHFAFPVCFLFLSLPWFFQIEYPLVQGLMRWNAVLVAHSLQFLGIFAEAAGNIIQLQNCQLGVEEACSGILSLQASVMMGCLLGEIYRLSFPRRLGLILASMSLALLGNYLRTFFLAMVAFCNGPDAVTRWHDTAGFSILVFTALGSWLSAIFLENRRSPGVIPVESNPNRKEGGVRVAQRLALGIFAVALLSEAGTQAWFGWRESSLIRHPEWTVNLPEMDTFQGLTLSDITRTALRCDFSKGGKWRDARGWDWTAFWFQYLPKPYTRIVLGWHTPDHCLPSVGWTKDRDYPGFTAQVNGLDFYVQPKRFLTKDSSIYVFWIVYTNSGDPPAETDTRIPLPFLSKFACHLQDVWNGYRGVGVETFEVAITGPPDYEAAQSGYLAALQAMARPDSAQGALSTGTFH